MRLEPRRFLNRIHQALFCLAQLRCFLQHLCHQPFLLVVLVSTSFAAHSHVTELWTSVAPGETYQLRQSTRSCCGEALPIATPFPRVEGRQKILLIVGARQRHGRGVVIVRAAGRVLDRSTGLVPRSRRFNRPSRRFNSA